MTEIALVKSPQVLDLPSESIFIWEVEGFPQTDYGAFLLKGKCDVEAMKTAVTEAIAHRPSFYSNLVTINNGIWSRYAWSFQAVPNELEVRDCRNMPELPEDLEIWIHDQMRSSVDHLQDLSKEYPVRIILFLLPENTQFLVMLFHHIATDGGGLYDFMRETFGRYHEIVTGNKPSWANAPGIHAQAKAPVPIKPIPQGRFWKGTIQELREFPRKRLCQVAGAQTGQTGRHMIRFVYDDPDFQKAIRDRARRDGGSVSDLCTAASMLAIDQWNQGKGQPSDVMHHGLAVNQRGRRDPAEIQGLGNPMSAIVIPSLPAHRNNPEALLQYIIETRKRKMEQGHDIILARFTHNLLKAGLLLPLSVRHNWLRHILDMKISFFVTNLGVVWPRMENGRPTGDTLIRQVGDMELLDIHSSVGTTRNNPVAMILRTFLSRFYVNFTVGRNWLSEQEAQAFGETVIQKIKEYI